MGKSEDTPFERSERMVDFGIEEARITFAFEEIATAKEIEKTEQLMEELDIE